MSLYLKDVRKSKLITQDREIELARRIRSGDKRAEKELIEANLKFVISTARKFQNLGIPIEDLISEGNLGLVKAAQRFDETRGFKFISYAVWWIKQSMLLSINENCSTIRIPINVRNEMLQQKKEAEKFAGDDLDKISRKVPQVTSYNNPINDDGDEMSAILIDDLVAPDQLMIDLELTLRDALTDSMSCLSHREKIIVIEYFGLGDTEGKTLEVIGDRLDLTKERVRQIRDKAIQKLRNNSEPLFRFFE